MSKLPVGLVSEYNKKKKEIKKRLKDFQLLHKSSYKDIFSELCFCLLTPQSNARYCDKAIQELKRTDLLLKGSARAISAILKGHARFHNKKADYIIRAREYFDRNIFKEKDIKKMRACLVKNIKGMGYKEASHFLRNVGLGKNIAILDRHILKNFKRCGVINNIPHSITPKIYIDIEDKAKEFSKRVKIPLGELDLLFWSKETGEIFK